VAGRNPVRRSSAPGLEPSSRVQFLPGAGPARGELLARLGIHTVADLVLHVPRAYLDATRSAAIRDLAPGRLTTVAGRITHAHVIRTRGGRADFTATVRDQTGSLECYWFGQSFLQRTLRPGRDLVVSGELDEHVQRRFVNPLFEVLEPGAERETLHVGRIVPVHAVTQGLGAKGMRRLVHAALEEVADRMPDPLPAGLAERHGLPARSVALRHIHFPPDAAALEAARHRLAFEEFLLLETVLQLRRRAFHQEGRGLVTAGPGEWARRARAKLPFPLTAGQERALAEIVGDLRRPSPMHRLLVGDVGSGKTVVAFLAAAHVLEAGFQVAFMAPTEILARQHEATLRRFAAPLPVPVEAWTGETRAAQRRALQARLEAGEPVLLVGTHALIERDVHFARLGLVVVDEQHRFGVRQRSDLTRKGALPDVLVMSATPIPRTLALTLYGDLDVSALHERPPGRGRVATRLVHEDQRETVIEFFAGEIGHGRQAYVVVPLVEESESADRRAAKAEVERLRVHPRLRGLEVGLLHGRMKGEEKRAVMEAFARGEIHILVATTVVEVGVDVANATLMLVEGAERFGLIQLHQLRGRIGRGAARSVFVMMAGPAAGAAARERLAELIRSHDGFALAEADLRLRGPGEPWGVRQTGLPRLRVGDLFRDRGWLEEARRAASGTIAADPQLVLPEHRGLRQELLSHYREPLELALAG
jgi:ATP-dependent DNA helicase RecG